MKSTLPPLLALLLVACAAPVTVPSPGALGGASADHAGPAKLNLPSTSGDALARVPLPQKSVEMPRAGERNAYRITVSEALERAYDAYMGGDGEGALRSIEAARSGYGDDPLARWHLSTLRLQVLLMMGRSADAESELAHNRELELARFGTDTHALALEAETLVWLGDLEGAKRAARRVAAAYGSWRMPTSYGGPPTNMAELVHATTAQLRAYVSLAIAHFLSGEMAEARRWAAEAEGRFADVHYVAGHPLYGSSVAVHADSFYGRATNLATLGAAMLAEDRDPQAAEALLEAARAFFTAVGYRSGESTIAALRAFALLHARHFEAASQAATEAVRLARERGLDELVWRIEVLRGRALNGSGHPKEAEHAYRLAQAAVDQVSGSLASDRAKRRFGVGKEEITRALVKFDIAHNDLPTLFEDLERGRARAFVDLLGEHPVAIGREKELNGALRALDAEIRALRLRLLSPAGTDADAIGRLQALIDRRGELIAQLRARDPELAELFSISSLELASVSARLTPGEALLYPLPAERDEAQTLLEIGHEGARLVTLAITPKRLRGLLAEFNRAVREIDVPAQQRGAERLSQALEVKRWKGRSRLRVVPSGDWHFIPWGALTVEVPVAVLPTGGWVARDGGRTGGATSATVVGDPEFFGTLEPLPGARAEARMVGRFYRVAPLTGKAATEAALRDATGRGVEVLHLATHGLFDAAHPLASAVYLSGDGDARALTAARLFEQPLAARLVVLSGCETGMGETVAGDDFLGLPRSLYLGGSTTVMSSLWPVADEGTRRFMETFHRHARDGDYGQAWLAARNRLRDEGYPPIIYGAFVLGGAFGG